MSYDRIKIKFALDGYLPDLPSHLISDIEMMNAFLINDSGYFYQMYPLSADNLKEQYQTLITAIRYHMSVAKNAIKKAIEPYVLPDWIQAYMLDSVLSVHSRQTQMHHFLVALNVDNLEDIYDGNAQRACFRASQKWLQRTHKKELVSFEGAQIDTRPPTMFGEPHVIKALRLEEVDPVLS